MNANVVQRMFVRDEGGEVFLGYLRIMSDFAAGVASFEYDDLGKAIAEHKVHVEAQFKKAQSQAVRDKYTWLADYHNWAVVQLGVGHASDDAFRLDRDPDARSFQVGWTEPAT